MKSKIAAVLGVSTMILCSLQADLVNGLNAYFPIDEGTGRELTEIFSGTTARYRGLHEGSVGPDWASMSPGVSLNGTEYQYFESESNQVGAGITDQITVCARVWRVGAAWAGIVTKGISQSPYSLLIWPDGRIGFIVNAYSPAGGSDSAAFLANHIVPAGEEAGWHHIAVTYDGARVRFYLDGVLDSDQPEADITFGTVDEPLILGVDLPGGDEHFTGGLRDVAIYDRALSQADILSLNNGASPALARVATSYTGLWVGQAQLDEVKELSSDTWQAAPSGFSEQVLLHVNRAGTARLLSQATIVQTGDSGPAIPEQVILSRSDLIPNYDGITPRGGTRVGQRFSSATVPMAEDSVLLAQNGETLSADLSQAPADPLNPFRHKYHPDLKNGYAIGRTLSFTVPAGDSPVDNEFTGTFSEMVTGLHKDALEARGSVTFIRVSTSGLLNN